MTVSVWALIPTAVCFLWLLVKIVGQGIRIGLLEGQLEAHCEERETLRRVIRKWEDRDREWARLSPDARPAAWAPNELVD